MFIDQIDITSLPEDPVDAFIEFERELRKLWQIEKEREAYQDAQNEGIYLGNYHADRLYVSTLVAFLDEYDLGLGVTNISDASDHSFQGHFSSFCNEINSAVTRLSLRREKIGGSKSVTLVSYSTDYKERIGAMLMTIRKIVNQEIENEPKKEKIFKKIALLQSEIDRDRTTADAVFSRAVDLSRSLGEVGENLEPLIDKFERLKKLIWDGAKKELLLPKSKNPKLIEPPSEAGFGGDLDDEIPF